MTLSRNETVSLDLSSLCESKQVNSDNFGCICDWCEIPMLCYSLLLQHQLSSWLRMQMSVSNHSKSSCIVCLCSHNDWLYCCLGFVKLSFCNVKDKYVVYWYDCFRFFLASCMPIRELWATLLSPIRRLICYYVILRLKFLHSARVPNTVDVTICFVSVSDLRGGIVGSKWRDRGCLASLHADW